MRENLQTGLSRGRRSRNKVSVGEPAEGSLQQQIQQSYRKIAVTPIHSPTHPIGRSDGRCVQRAGTYSVYVDDIHLLGIPSLHVKISKRDSI